MAADVVKAITKSTSAAGDGVDDPSFSFALRIFNKTRLSVAGCLRSAISAYLSEESRRATLRAGLNVFTADTDDGEDTALVITGFRNRDDIEQFLREKLCASGK